MMLNLAARSSQLFHCKYRSVYVGCLYTVVAREVSGCGITKYPRKEWTHQLLFLLLWNGSMLLMCSRNLFLCWFYDHKTVMHIPLQHFWRVLSCMYGSGLKVLHVEVHPCGVIGDPIAAPWSCSKNLPWNWKYLVLTQNSSSLMIWSTVMDVLWWNSWYSSSYLLMMLMAGSVGTDVKSAEASYEEIHSCWSCIPWFWSTKSLVLYIFGGFAYSDLRTLASFFAASYMVLPLLKAIVLRWMSVLWTLGRTQHFGATAPVAYIFL